jgi:hypothetical protein
MARGGARKGAGRKSVADEEKAREKAKAAITELYGSMEEGIKTLLQSDEPSLIKFVWEHALGKPTDQVDLTSNGETIGQPQEIIFKDYSKK